MKALAAIHEVQIVYKRPLLLKVKRIETAKDAYHILNEFVDSKRIDYKEFFWVMLISRSNELLSISEIGVGATAGVLVNYKEIFQLAILSNASAIIVAHNHPSGNLEPSEADKKMTKRLSEFAKLMDIALLDHIIISSQSYISLADQGLL